MGLSFIRQTQVRYTHAIDERTDVSFSLKNPEGTSFANANDRAPDLTFGFRWGSADGKTHMEATAELRYLEFDDGENDDSALGHGVLLAGNRTFGNTTLMAGGIYGEGVGRYIYLNGGSAEGTGVGAAFIDENNELETIKSYGIVAPSNTNGRIRQAAPLLTAATSETGRRIYFPKPRKRSPPIILIIFGVR